MEAKEAQTVFNKVLIEQDKRKYLLAKLSALHLFSL